MANGERNHDYESDKCWCGEENWPLKVGREQPQEPSRCPTCGSDDKAVQKWPCAERYRYRTSKADSWHDEGKDEQMPNARPAEAGSAAVPRADIFVWLEQALRKSGWNVGRFVQFAEEYGHIQDLADTLHAFRTSAVSVPPCSCSHATEASEGGEKPQCPHDEIDGEGRCRDCREPATPAQGAPQCPKHGDTMTFGQPINLPNGKSVWFCGEAGCGYVMGLRLPSPETPKEFLDWWNANWPDLAPTHQALHAYIFGRAATPTPSVMGAREFHENTFKLSVLLFAVSDPMGFSRRATDEEMLKRVYEFAEAYAADQVRQAEVFPHSGMRARELAIDICRELYDKFVMGGWQPVEAHDYVNDVIEGHTTSKLREAEAQYIKDKSKQATHLCNKIDDLRAEAYAADQVRQADQQALVDNEQLNDEITALRVEVAQLQQERDADEQMWRERCDAASKAGYEVAMEQEREARERAEKERDALKKDLEIADADAERYRTGGNKWSEMWQAEREARERAERALREAQDKVTAALNDYIENSLTCECGEGDPSWKKKKAGKMYNTECGHAIECPIYLAREMAESVNRALAQVKSSESTKGDA